MSDNTPIEWTDATANYVNGCDIVSPGCTNCYAMRSGGRNLPGHPSTGLTKPSKAGHVWTGEVRRNEKILHDVLRWKRPRRIFWNAHGDLFHPAVPDAWIDAAFAVMALTPHHTHQVLTKRPERMREYLTSIDNGGERLTGEGWRSALVEGMAQKIWHERTGDNSVDEWLAVHLPLPNVWLGTSVEDQTRADERIPHLLATPAAVRFISAEPLLGPVDLRDICTGHYFTNALMGHRWHDAPDGVASATDMGGHKINWVIVGGESGPGARPMHPGWARSLRDQCAATGVPFHFKQWGEYWPSELAPDQGDDTPWRFRPDGTAAWQLDEKGIRRDGLPQISYQRYGKKRAGRLLDGVQHDGFPA